MSAAHGGRPEFAVERRERGGMNYRRFWEVLWVKYSSSGDWSTVDVGIDVQETLSQIEFLCRCYADTLLLISTFF